MKTLKLLLLGGFTALMCHPASAYLSLKYATETVSTTLSTSDYSRSDRGIKYTASTKRLELSKKNTTYTLSGTANDGTHVFVLASGIILCLDGVNITVPDATKESPIRLRGCDASVVVTGDSVLKGSVERAGIGVNPGGDSVTDYTATLTLRVNYGKTLTVTGGDYAAGIGGNKGEINGLWMEFGGSGKLVARGGKGAPGIGSGYGASTTRKIVFGTGGLEVEATGGAGAAGVGGGSGTVGAPVYNYGAQISATGKGGGAGIGGGKGAAGGSFYNYLSGGGCEVVAVGAYDVDLAGTSCAGAGIGAGYGTANAGTVVISNGTVSASSMSPLSTSCGAGIGGGGGTPSCSGTIKIIGGIVQANSTFGAGIGGGYKQVNPTISIEGGKVSAMSASGGAGIGSGNNNTSKGTLFGPITISGGRVTATGVGGGAGIGGGNKSDCAKLTISGGTVDASGSGKAYDIGAGEDPYSDTSAKVITGGNVYCRNGRYPMIKDAAGNQIGPMKIRLRPALCAAENLGVEFGESYADSDYGRNDIYPVNDGLWLWFHPKKASELRIYWIDQQILYNQYCKVEAGLEYDAKIRVRYAELYDEVSYLTDLYHEYTKTYPYYREFPLPSHERTGYAFAGWSNSRSSGERLTDNLAITNVNLYAQYLPTVDIQAALDNSVLTFTRSKTGKADYPYGQKAVSNYGGSAVRFGESGHSSTGNVQTVVYGPGKISFDWKQSCEYDYDYLELLDISSAGTSVLKTRKADSSTAWKTETCDIGDGRNVLTWQYRRDSSMSKNDNIAYLDHIVWKPRVRWITDSASGACARIDYPEASSSAVLGELIKPDSQSGYVFTGWYTASSGGTRVTPDTAVPTQATDYYAHWTKEIDKGVAFGDTTRTITTGATSASDQHWFGQFQIRCEGAGALRSGTIEAGHETWFEIKVNGAGKASYNMGISADAADANLKFYIDGVRQHTLAGLNGWLGFVSYITYGGEHTLRWTFTKTGSAISGEDCAWVADFVWTPDAAAVAAADDLNGDGRADIVMTIDKAGHPADGSTGAWLIQNDQTAAWGDLSQRDADWDILGLGATAPNKATKDVYLVSPDNVVGAWTTDNAGKVTGWKTIDSFDGETMVGGLGDFNGDGQSDLLLVNDNGAIGCYFTSGAKTGWNYFQSLGDEWQICGIGDLNGDGRDDLVLLHDEGFAGSWLTQADGTMEWANLDTLQPGFAIVGCGDFDGDGTDDVLLKKDSYYGAWLVQDGQVRDWMGLGDLGDVTVEQIADFDGDGRDDLRIRTAAGDLGAELVKGEDSLTWAYYGSVGAEWLTEPLGLK